MTGDCETIRPQLIGFHFGISTRDPIEAHLMTCSACLRELLDVKRAIETGDDGPRPNDIVRARLRAAVAREVIVVRRWWDKPVALAFACSILLASWGAMSALTSGPGEAPYAMRASDSAR